MGVEVRDARPSGYESDHEDIAFSVILDRNGVFPGLKECEELLRTPSETLFV
jgi:hypothetical protein